MILDIKIKLMSGLLITRNKMINADNACNSNEKGDCSRNGGITANINVINGNRKNPKIIPSFRFDKEDILEEEQ